MLLEELPSLLLDEEEELPSLLLEELPSSLLLEEEEECLLPFSLSLSSLCDESLELCAEGDDFVPVSILHTIDPPPSEALFDLGGDVFLLEDDLCLSDELPPFSLEEECPLDRR